MFSIHSIQYLFIHSLRYFLFILNNSLTQFKCSESHVYFSILSNVIFRSEKIKELSKTRRKIKDISLSLVFHSLELFVIV